MCNQAERNATALAKVLPLIDAVACMSRQELTDRAESANANRILSINARFKAAAKHDAVMSKIRANTRRFDGAKVKHVSDIVYPKGPTNE